jgi:hypothetical protein
VEWVLEPARSLPEDGATEESVALEQRVADAIGRVRMVTTVGPRGGTLSLSLDRPPGLRPEAERLFTGMEESARNLSASLPEEPVGVGAVWDVTRVATIMGIRCQQTTSHELVAIDGDRVTLRLQMQQTALPQEYPVPGAPEDVRARIETFNAAGSGDVVIDLTKPGLVENTSTGRVAFSMSFDAAEGKSGKISFDARFDVKHLP